MKNYFISMLFIILSFLAAEGMVGHWEDIAKNVDIYIHKNGTYKIVKPYQGTGQCSIQNNVFFMRDYNSNATFSYKIQSITNDAMLLYDNANQTYLNLKRVSAEKVLIIF